MIDLEKLKQSLAPRKPGEADYAYQYVNIDLNELICALEEAKFILGQDKNTPTIYVYQEAQKWLAKYFQDTDEKK